MEYLRIFTAGVAKKLVSDTAEKWDSSHALKTEITSCGSVELARRISGGEACDVFISADEAILPQMLMPELAAGYIVFAGNSIVIQDLSGKGINSLNWKEKLLAPEAVFKNKNPYADPGGYRGVMAMLLADKFEPGLSQKLMQHPGHVGMNPDISADKLPEADYLFTYYSMAMAAGAEFAELPDIMNLSKPELNESYAEVSFSVDEKNSVRGSAISHCVTIPKSAEHRDEAGEFIKELLNTDLRPYYLRAKKEYIGEKII